MFGVRYYKADASTFVIKTVNGKVLKQGKGLSFFYNASTSSIAAVPVNAQEAPFIFNLKTADFQQIKVQGQVTYKIQDPEKTAAIFNFNLKKDGVNYISEDPIKLGDRIVRATQTIIQNQVQDVTLKSALRLSQALVKGLNQELGQHAVLQELGIVVLDVTISAISPSSETHRALEAEAREAILKEADDAIYLRRKSSVEQERTIKAAELQTELFVQQKEQEIEESRIQNERAVLRGHAETEHERIQSDIDAETQRKALVAIQAENSREQADVEAYAMSARINAFKNLPVENLKAMALANMQAEQLMAVAFDSLAQNADKIGELNISPDLLGQAMKQANRR